MYHINYMQMQTNTITKILTNIRTNQTFVATLITRSKRDFHGKLLLLILTFKDELKKQYSLEGHWHVNLLLASELMVTGIH